MKTRKELEDVIRNGGSVIVGGRHITRIEDLPKDAEPEKGDGKDGGPKKGPAK